MANTAGVAIGSKLIKNGIFLIENEIFLIGNGIFLIRNYPGAPVFHVPCIATQPKKFIKGSSVVKDQQKKFDLEWSL